VLHKNIPIAATGLYNKLVLHYTQQHEALKPFYLYAPVMSSFAEVIANRTFEQHKRDVLVEVLQTQYAKIGIERKQSAAVFANIDALAKPNTFTVTTGHQLAIFTGPLFFVYKILSTIRLAQELKLQYPDKHFVPVFWLASEDHDFAEINHTHIQGHKVEWNIASENKPVGELSTQAIKQTIEELVRILGAPNQLVNLFKSCYLQSENMSQATHKLAHALFAEYGLVVLEPNDAALKNQFTQAILSDILEHNSFNALLQTNTELGKHYSLQVTGREINFFYLNEHGRNQIKKTRSGYEVSNTQLQWREAEIKTEIQQYPERFSPNVVMRPVYQEQILPNLAYIGGPGEVAYWLQLKRVFETHDIPFPMVVLRNSVLLVKQAQLHKLAKKGVTIEQLLQSDDKLVKTIINAQYPLSIKSQSQQTGNALQQAIDNVMAFDNKIGARIIKWKVEAMQQLAQLEKELVRSKKQRSASDIEAILAIKHNLFPDGQPQERHQNIAAFTGDYYSSFIQHISKQLFPLSNTLDVLVWD
jgi:bacillithiol synthase